jgi:hypothetical protein
MLAAEAVAHLPERLRQAAQAGAVRAGLAQQVQQELPTQVVVVVEQGPMHQVRVQMVEMAALVLLF